MPASRVLLVDDDVDELADLATKLRERGVRVSLANSASMACERAKSGGYDVVLAAKALAEPTDGSMGIGDALSVELTEVPPLLVLGEAGASGESCVPADDVGKIVERVEQLTSNDERSAHPSFAPSSHSLEHAPLGDLLVVLATECRSGTLTVTTSKGSGEVRLVDGEIADAVYVRLEGIKAVTRMIAERAGTATFTPGSPAIMRRIHEGTRAIVEEARARVERVTELLRGAGDLATTTLVSLEGTDEDLSPIEQDVLARLRVPVAVDDVLDDLPHADTAIMEALLRLDERGRIGRLGHASARVALCGPDQLHLVRASASRARASGFVGPARLVFAATPARLAVFGHTVLSLADAFPPSEPAPPLPVPYVLATIRLGDGVDLDVAALPLVPAYAPLWPLALGGAAIVVRLDEGAAAPLSEACATIGLPILDARAIFGELDESSPVQIASLVRTALEAEGSAA